MQEYSQYDYENLSVPRAYLPAIGRRKRFALKVCQVDANWLSCALSASSSLSDVLSTGQM